MSDSFITEKADRCLIGNVCQGGKVAPFLYLPIRYTYQAPVLRSGSRKIEIRYSIHFCPLETFNIFGRQI